MLSKIHVSARPVAALLAMAFACLFANSDASALTAKDVTDKMSNDERSSYLFGSIDMMQLQAEQAGDDQRSQCISKAYFQSDGSKTDAWSKLYSALLQFPEKQAPHVIFLMTKKTCGG